MFKDRTNNDAQLGLVEMYFQLNDIFNLQCLLGLLEHNAITSQERSGC